MSELNAYYEQISKRSSSYRGQSVGGNLTGSLGSQPGLSNTVGGGNQVIETSSKIDGISQFTEKRSVNNIPDDPKAYISSNQSSSVTSLTLGRQEAFLGNAGQTTGSSDAFGGSDITR